MKTWDDYKEHVKQMDALAKEDIEAQTTTPNISTLLKFFRKLGLRLSVTNK